VYAGSLLALFVCGLVAGAVTLAATVRPRLLRGSADSNRYSFVQLASGPGIAGTPPTGTPAADEAAIAGSCRTRCGSSPVSPYASTVG
jgi:hypothetical protein